MRAELDMDAPERETGAQRMGRESRIVPAGLRPGPEKR